VPVVIVPLLRPTSSEVSSDDIVFARTATALPQSRLLPSWRPCAGIPMVMHKRLKMNFFKSLNFLLIFSGTHATGSAQHRVMDSRLLHHQPTIKSVGVTLAGGPSTIVS
jgi:hypothetical protein